MSNDGALRSIAMLGNHLPRECGIATFTTHLAEAISSEFLDLDCFVLAMNDPGRRHAYPERVRFELAEGDLSSYRRAADFLNVNTIDLVCVQHEFGIFGGKAGSHVLVLLRELRMPIVTTFHTILAEPNPMQHRVMDELASLSERVVVMSAHGGTLLQEVHGVPADKIDLIPHGIPEVPLVNGSKDRLGVEGKSVLLTFGLLSPDKGIENVIMPFGSGCQSIWTLPYKEKFQAIFKETIDNFASRGFRALCVAKTDADGKWQLIGLIALQDPPRDDSAETIRKANSVHAVCDLQIEYSVISRGPERKIFPVLKELGIGATAYGVLSRGLLSGSILGRPEILLAAASFGHERLHLGLVSCADSPARDPVSAAQSSQKPPAAAASPARPPRSDCGARLRWRAAVRS